MGTTRYRFFVGVTPGLEALLKAELAELALDLRGAAEHPGGLELAGDRETLWRLCRTSRLAEGVRVRIGKPFVARDFAALEAAVAKLPWHAFCRRGAALPRLRVHTERSRLYHSGAVAERVLRVIGARLQATTPRDDGPRDDGPREEGPRDDVLDERPTVHARIADDLVQLSVDACGEPLHRRGYRVATLEAPLRETLAAACLRAAGYRGRRLLWDPFCGAGTIVLEAAGLSRGVAPGATRGFAFERWPTHDARAYTAAATPADVSADAATVAAPCWGSDRDPRALAAARHNTERLGLRGALRWRQGEPDAIATDVPRGALIVCNPPYGKRLGRGDDVRRTYAGLGRLLARRRDLEAWVLTGSPLLERAAGPRWRVALAFKNRGLPVRLYRLER